MFEGREGLFVERRIEVLGLLEAFGFHRQGALSRGPGGHQSGHDGVTPANRDLLARLHPPQQAGQVRLGFVNAHFRHDSSVHDRLDFVDESRLLLSGAPLRPCMPTLAHARPLPSSAGLAHDARPA